MRPLTNAQAYAIAAATGAGMARRHGDQRQARGVGLAAVLDGRLSGGHCGRRCPRLPRARAPMAMVARAVSAQAVTMVVAASSFSLLPLGLIMFAALSLPGAAAAAFAAAARSRALS